MKKLLILLSAGAIISLVITTIIVFNLPNEFKTQVNQASKQSQTTVITADTPSTEKVPRKVTYEEKIKKGDLLAKNNYYTLSITEYTLASQIKPDSIEPYLKIGNIHLKSHSYAKAIANFRIALNLKPDDLESQINLGRALIGQNDFATAKQTFNNIKEQSQLAKYYQAMISAFFGDYEKSQQLFNEVREINTSKEISAKSSQFLNSFANYGKAKDAPATYLKTMLAKNFTEVEESALTVALLDGVLKDTPDYRDAWILKGYALLQIGDYQPSISALNQALKLDPAKAEIRYFLGLANFAINKTDEAITQLEVALQNGFKPEIQVYQKLAEMYLIKQDYKNSISNYEKVLQTKDLAIDYFVRPIWIYIEFLNQPASARRIATQALEIHPNSAMAYNLLGWAYLAEKNYNLSQQNLDKALKINPDLGAAYLNLGKLYEEQNNLELAKNNYKKAYELNPGDAVGNLAAQKYNELLQKKE